MAVIQPRPTHMFYQCPKFGEDRTSFNVIFDVCAVQHVKCLYPYFDILVFYFSATSRYIDLKFIQDTYMVVINPPTNIDLHMSKVKVTGTVHCFLKVQSYHKN